MAAHDDHIRVDRAAIEVSDLDRAARIGKVHHRDSALVPSLHLDIAAGNRNKRTVMSNAVLACRLCSRQLVVVTKGQLVVSQAEHRVRSPYVRVGRTTSSAHAAAPLV